MMPDVELVVSAYAADGAAAAAAAVVLMTDRNVLRALDLERLAPTVAQPAVVDGRNVHPPKDVEQAGLRRYFSGRAPKA